MGFKSLFDFSAVLLIGVASTGAAAARADALVIEGNALVVDAATVEIWGQRIHLSGIAVPDPKSEDGENGRRFLQQLLAGVRLRCKIEEAPFRTEMLGRCFVANIDIVGPLVQMGYARKLVNMPDDSNPQSDATEQMRSSNPASTHR